MQEVTVGEFYSPPPTGGLANYIHIFIHIYSTSFSRLLRHVRGDSGYILLSPTHRGPISQRPYVTK